MKGKDLYIYMKLKVLLIYNKSEIIEILFIKTEKKIRIILIYIQYVLYNNKNGLDLEKSQDIYLMQIHIHLIKKNENFFMKV